MPLNKRSPSGSPVIKHMVIDVPQQSIASGTTKSQSISVPADFRANGVYGVLKATPLIDPMPNGLSLAACYPIADNTVGMDFTNTTGGSLNVSATSWLFTFLLNPALEGV